MDKAEMSEEMKKSFKKMSVVPNEKDFTDVILSLKDFPRPVLYVKGATFKLNIIRRTYVAEVRCANRGFLAKLRKVRDEFPLHGQRRPVYDDFLQQGFYFYHLVLVLEQLFLATILMKDIANTYVWRLNKDDCDSMQKCKRLKVSALGCMCTVAMRCVPSLAYIEKVRQHMVEAIEKNLEDENAAATLTNNVVLAEEDCTVPDFCVFDIQNVDDDFVHPETLSWLWELEHKHGLKLQDEEGESAKLARKLKKNLAMPLAA